MVAKFHPPTFFCYNKPVMKLNLNKINPTVLAIAGLFILVVGGGFAIIHDKVGTATASGENLTLVSEPVVSEPVVVAPADMDAFTKCLTENGAGLYGASWCPHCQKQKKLFGESIQFVNYIECAPDGSRTQAQVCKDAGITGYPTWQFFDGSQILGEASFQQLSEKTNCSF